MCYVMCVLDNIVGVTQLRDVVYIVCRGSSAISRFHATTHQQLEDIMVKDLRVPCDIAACERTSRVYILDALECIWRVSSDGEDVKCWLSKSPLEICNWWSLSVTSSRILVTSHNPSQLIQYNTFGDELRRVLLADYMFPFHSIELPAGTFITSYDNRQLKQRQVSQVNTNGHELHQFSGSHLLPLVYTPHIAVDSQGNIFLADWENRRILLLNSQLALRRVIISEFQLDEHKLDYEKPQRLCYIEQLGQLLVVLDQSVAVFDV